MNVKCLSIKNPISYLVCAGIKDVENRSWKTDYRGTLYIHSSGNKDFYYFWKKLFSPEFFKKYEMVYDEINNLNKNFKHDEISKNIIKFDEKVVKFYKAENYSDFADNPEIKIKAKSLFCKSGCIIGKVDIVDVKENYKSIWSDDSRYQWIIENPVLFAKPIENIKGLLRFFNINI